jgi:hypothetical protein
MEDLDLEFVGDDHQGTWRPLLSDFLWTALDYLARKTDDDCLHELRWIYAGATLRKRRPPLPRGQSAGSTAIPSSRTGPRTRSVRR